MDPDAKKLLDNGGAVVLFRNELGSYTAAVLRGGHYVGLMDLMEAIDDVSHEITDDFEPSKAIHRLAEKQIGNIV